MSARYPNLELLEYKCASHIYKEYVLKLTNIRYLKYTAQMFLQTWVNTATGFDLENVCSGQAFTDAYTTVFEVSWYDLNDEGRWMTSDDRIYVVFFRDNIAYSYLNPNEEFFNDLCKRRMKSQKEALESYE